MSSDPGDVGARLDLEGSERSGLANNYPAIVDEPVTIDLDDATDRWRYTCPAGHRSIEGTNAHGWCAQCAQLAGNGADVAPEFDFLVDQRREARVPWKYVEFEGSGRQRP